MVSAKTTLGTATSTDLAELERCEVLSGVIEHKAAPSFEHGDAQGALVGVLNGSFRGRGGGGHPP